MLNVLHHIPQKLDPQHTHIYIFFISSAWFQDKPADFIKFEKDQQKFKIFEIQNLRDSSMMRIGT